MTESTRQADRAVEEIIGMVLLIVLVLLGSTVVVVLGASALSDAQDQTRVEAAQHQLQELDARLSTLAAGNGEGEAEFDAGNDLVSDYRIDRSGYLNVTVDHNRTCSFQQELTSVVFEDSQGRTVGYEAGGVWRAGLDGSTAISPPDVTFQDGALDVQLLNLTGQVDQQTNVAALNVTATQNRSQAIAKALRTGQCVRPDNVTIFVKSRFQTGWHNYLESELGVGPGNVRSFPGNGTVRAYIPQGALHPSADDRTNHVVNLRHVLPGVTIPYMENVTLEGRAGSGGPATINVSKDAGNTYTAYIEPLTGENLDIGRRKNISGAGVLGPPLDVVLIMDESGSMGDSAPPYPTKTAAAIDSAKIFVGDRNESRDRFSIQGYNTEGTHYVIDGKHFSRDFDAVNDTLDNEIDNSGGTRIDRGLNHSNAVFDLKSNESRRKVAVLLTDGRNNACSDSDPTYACDDNVLTLESARRAANASITVYTVGFGSDVRDELLRDVAQATGGKYYPAADANEVRAAFKNISESENRSGTDAIVSTPLTSNITTGGQLFDADIPGDTSHIATVNAGSATFLNINDPTAPALFSHSFPHADTDEFDINISSYDCKDGAWNVTGQTRRVGGRDINVARCTDINTSSRETYGADIYVDGERPDTLIETTYKPWQTDVNKTLDRFPSVNIDSSTGELEAQSNQAIIVFDLPPRGAGEHNALALLFQVGLSDQQAAGEEIVSVRVAQAELRN